LVAAKQEKANEYLFSQLEVLCFCKHVNCIFHESNLM